MAEVTGYTADRMKQIEDNSVVDGNVNGSGHLILAKYNGATIDAGNVVGPTGATGATGPAGADGDVEEAPSDGDHYTRRNGLWVPLEGAVTADLVSGMVKKYTAAVTHGSAISSTTPTTIATIVVPAVTVDSVLEVAAWWNFYFQDSGDTFYMLVQVDGVTKGKNTMRSPAVNHRNTFCIPTSTLVILAAANGATVTVKVARESGTGAVVQENAGVVTAEVIPA